MAASKATRDAIQIRGVVSTFNHDEAYTVHLALLAYAAVLRVVDQSFPDPDQRVRANDADRLSGVFRSANLTRAFLEGDEK